MKRYSCHMVAEDAAPNIVCTSPEEVARFCKDVLCLHESPQELVYVFYLNTKGGFVGYELVAKGGISDALVYPRDIFRGAIVLNAASIIMVHSHPSGNPTPSQIDVDLTRRLSECGDLLGIRLLDHIIIGESYFSFRQEGRL